MESAVQQVISQMWGRYFEPIKLHELASSVFVSPFHFLRIFAKTTGVTPGRYLSAVRMFEAKRLLVTTSLTVSDIVCSVGYSSVGTFTTRFTQAVGMTPSQYREPGVGELFVALGPEYGRVPAADAVRGADLASVHTGPPTGPSIVGSVEVPPEVAPANVFVGVFSESVPQCAPVAHEYLHEVGSSRLAIHGVPPGNWVLITVAESKTGTGETVLLGAQRHHVAVTPGGPARVRLKVRHPVPTDPPVAVSLAGKLAEADPVPAPRRDRAALRVVPAA